MIRDIPKIAGQTAPARASSYNAGDVFARLRQIWGENLSLDLNGKRLDAQSVSLSRQKGEVWIVNSTQAYRMQNQPTNFDAYMKWWEGRQKGWDARVAAAEQTLREVDKAEAERDRARSASIGVDTIA